MICIFAPLDAYFANMEEYWFSIGQLLGVCFVTFIIFALIFVLIAFVSKKIKKNYIFYAIALTCFVFTYIQGNYIPRDYGALDGTEIIWNDYKLYAALSIILFALCLIFLFVIIKFFKKNIYKIGIAFCLFVLIIQLSTTGVLFLQNINNLKKEPNIMTDKNLFDYSKDNNIIVFLLDSYDGYILNEMLEEDKEYQESILENFTYYVDTAGGYPTTKASLPLILTGERYENHEPFKEFVNKAYENNGIYQALEKNDYQLDVYTSLMFLNTNKIDYSNVEVGKYIISNKLEFAKRVFKLVEFNYMPHQLKKHFYIDNEEFSKFRKTNLEYTAFSSDNLKFLEKYYEQGISVNRNGNVFKFIHLDGTHAPATFGKELNENGKEYTMKDEGYGNNELLKMFFEDFKENNIYDNSTIVILADHGAKGYRQNPIFLIKNKNESHPFEISYEKMSFDYLKDIWVNLANNKKVDQDFIKSLSNGNPRRFLYYTWGDFWAKAYMPGMQEMLINGEASDSENMTLTGRRFLATSEKHDYKLGNVLEFDGEKTAFDNVLFGINGTTLLNKSLLAFDFDQSFENIKVEIETDDNNVTRLFSIKANDNVVAELSFGGPKEIKTFIIPKEYLNDDTLELTLERVKKQGEEFNDLGSSGVNIKTIKLESTDESVDLIDQIETYKYDFGTLLDFHTNNNTGYKYVVNGFSASEEGGTWTNGKSANLKLNIRKTDKKLLLELNHGIFNNKQHIQINCNNVSVADYISTGDEIKIVEIPTELVQSNTLNIEFVLPDAVSPESLGKGNDKRELSIRLYTLKIYEE